jgi:WD40 repeat protein
MEAATFYQALHAVSHIHGLVVKGVCDHANMNKKDTFHDYAARVSAVYLLTFIKEYVTEQTMPRRDGPLPSNRAGPSGVWNIPNQRNLAFTLEPTNTVGELTSSRGSKLPQVDWDLAPSGIRFFGRTRELTQLVHWIGDDHCRVVAIVGSGMIGKTSLAVALATQMKDAFERLFWRSLENPQPVVNYLQETILFLSNQQEEKLPKRVDKLIDLLLKYLQEQRCLLILDNVNSVFQAGEYTGKYQEQYVGFGELIQRLGGEPHQSCLLLTSRDKPTEVTQTEGKMSPVRSMNLDGLSYLQGGKELLNELGVLGSRQEQEDLIRYYGGNPYQLILAAPIIKEVYEGDLARFLKREPKSMVSDSRRLFNEEFSRLSKPEQAIMYWLAIEREPASLEQLEVNWADLRTIAGLSEVLLFLRRRFLIQTSQAGGFTLIPAVREYVTERLIERVYEEIVTESFALFESHALIKAQAKEHVRNSQLLLILTPLVERLFEIYTPEALTRRLLHLLDRWRNIPARAASYAAGNVLNLLVQGECPLRGADFTHLTVRHAFLRNAALPEVNFAHSRLKECLFKEPFGGLLCVTWSPDGKLLAAGTTSEEIHVWQAESETPERNWRGHDGWVWSVAFHPDGQFLVSGAEDGLVRLWNISTGQVSNTPLKHEGRVTVLAFSPDGRLLVSAGDDRTVQVWEWKTRTHPKVWRGHPSPIRALAFSSDGQMLASGDGNGMIWIWNVMTETEHGEALKVWQGHENWIRSLAFSPDRQLLASSANDQQIRLWEVGSWNEVGQLPIASNRIWSVAFSPDGGLLASGSEDQIIRLWDVRKKVLLRKLLRHENRVRMVRFSPGGQELVSGSEDKTVRLWTVPGGQLFRVLQGYTNGIWKVVFSADGQRIASGSEDGIVRLWDVSGRRLLSTLAGHRNRVTAVAFSPDGHLLVSGGDDGAVRVWNGSTGKHLEILRGHGNPVHAVAFSPDGSLFASGSSDNTIQLWAVSTWKRLQTLNYPIAVRAVAFSPNSRLLVSGCEDGSIWVWEVNAVQHPRLLLKDRDDRRIRSVAFSRSGKWLASGGDNRAIHIWDVDKERLHQTIPISDHDVCSVAFSPTGRLASSGDQAIRIWNIRNRRCITLNGHTKRVWSVTFSQDGRLLASGSEDNTIKLWNGQTGEYLATLQCERPYEGMNITSVTELTEAQKAGLEALGAFEGVQ